MSELLAEAAGLLADRAGAEPDTVKAAAVESPDLLIADAPPGPEPTEPDPDGGLPYPIATEHVGHLLAQRLPEVARELGVEGVAAATSCLQSLPRELTALLDAEGFFAGRWSWPLLATIERNRVRADPDDEKAAHVPVTPDNVAGHAAEHGLPGDLATVDAVVRAVNSLPPRIRAGLSPAMASDPDLWALAAHLGGRLFAHQLRRPVGR